ncbi:hypothetical protein COT97_02270 [Candidatus Falkowbacteria bacterium CG10_big_fil_rev_8_21_14_0_10_39_11]|uniref:Peptidase S11 D-alanyl-D-alanine carboxypeptidase A N-terminal domain-containing protein n=1 Tax=Candidatus Falkowbacteria bacterium CG10_big_fil_rev_8_21_14_0_10_39_11 TaxID=1974565 RepID=A0A2H0V5F6_9BACT|nr:MAG: hypothetical protein COT97_02270 [Candidatus Falkowbacteria bacterium CG10_big_fil_rev_8_21_14_0_10_39_11]
MSLLKVILSLLLISSQAGVFAVENEQRIFLDQEKVYQEEVPVRINEENIGVEITAEKFVVIDIESGLVLLESHSQVKQPIASITKLMTAMVILDFEPNWQQSVMMSLVDETSGAYPHIYRGEEVLFYDMWKAGLISSDNNAIMAMVRSLGVSRIDFVQMMNEKAKELKLYNTKFADPTGLNAGNMSTASDVARLVYEAMKHNEIRESVLQESYKFDILNNKKKRTIVNTDILLDSFLNSEEYGYELVGGKTGFLPEAGYCLAVEIEHENKPVMIAVLNSDTISDRFQDTKVLADWVFNNYEW